MARSQSVAGSYKVKVEPVLHTLKQLCLDFNKYKQPALHLDFQVCSVKSHWNLQVC